MNKDEFFQKLTNKGGFFSWTSNRERSEPAWWLSLATYAEEEYERARKREMR
jgi:hypothetical protein